MEIIEKYFPDLSSEQKLHFAALQDLYREWNAQINVISRKDIDHLYERHVLHSLAIGRFVNFAPNTQILDVGTGGGFPGIPLAILFPEVRFTLVDSIGKKIKVVQNVSQSLGLTNVISKHERAENVKQTFDFVVSRAVTNLPVFYSWIKNKIRKDEINTVSNGILYLKGGDVETEIKKLNLGSKIIPLSSYFDEAFFESKLLVHIYKR
jgi:16S rRNA (guanine527-N7)-methyltransferase